MWLALLLAWLVWALAWRGYRAYVEYIGFMLDMACDARCCCDLPLLLAVTLV